jgi:RND family efflux transporter MFP subunit
MVVFADLVAEHDSGVATALPLLLLCAFLLLIGLLFGERFVPSRAVELVTVVTQRASLPPEGSGRSTAANGAALFEGSPLFQASGWIEPDPLPIRVTALYAGVIETVEVLEGESVAKGQLLATLIDDDAWLDVATAQALLAEREAALGNAEARARESEASLQTLNLQIEAASARLEELRDEATRLERAGSEVFPERDVVQASLRAQTQAAQIEALQARRAELEAMLESRQALVEQARHALGRADTELARRQLALDRTRIHSPVDGVVQELYAAPGMKRMLAMDGLESATVAKLYQPDSLQARIDVPLEEAARLSIGQPVRLRSSLFPNRVFKGRVARIVGQADLQRNTLQAKVVLLDPDPKLRPEMLCRAEFLAPPASTGAALPASGDRVAVFVPESALLGEGDAASVWILDASGERAMRQSVELAGERRAGYVRVRTGLKPGDRVVVNPPADLQAGQRIESIETN